MINFAGNNEEAQHWLEQDGYVFVKKVKDTIHMISATGKTVTIKRGVVEFV